MRYVGVTVGAFHGEGDPVWGDTTVYVDSITFSNDARADVDFIEDAGGFAVSADSEPIEGSAVTHLACEDQTGPGGAGGAAPGTSGAGGAGGAGGDGGA